MTCNGRCYSDMQYVYFNLLMKEKKRKLKTHQWSPNLISWCLSHWSMIIYFVLWTVFKYFFLSCYPVLIMVKFPSSMFLLWIHRHGPYFISDSIHFFCLFVFILFSCSWVTKYLECESLCSSCTRIEIIAMIIKKIWLNYTCTISVVV